MQAQPQRVSGRVVGAVMFIAALAVTVAWIILRVFFTTEPVAADPSPGPAAQVPRPRAIGTPFDHVVVLSIDGLRADAVEDAVRRGRPGFAALLAGPHTLEARTDPDITVTLPNHAGMVTGRLFKGPQGHNWLPNDLPPTIAEGGTLHAAHGSYVPSMWDVAHDHGLTTAMLASKDKFMLFDNSYREEQGRPDAVGADDGTRKIDLVGFALRSDGIARKTCAFLDAAAADGRRSLCFIHFADTDVTGHGRTWDMSPGSDYLDCVDRMDALVDRLVRHVGSNPGLRDRTAIIMTADHGGGAPAWSHTVHDSPLNFRIPFVVWTGDGAAGDLYALSPSRTRPAAT
ncbi:MAG: hypothetical protein RLZZ246_2003, partial [Planctomycetota bacterium]